jgi:mRNA interferase MazF
MPKRGEVWLVRFPFSDLATTKLRPALVLAVHGEDVIVIGIFSRVPATVLRGTWVKIEDRHAAFVRTGLKKTSVAKCEKIAVVHRSVLQRRLGLLPRDLMSQVLTGLKKALLLP